MKMLNVTSKCLRFRTRPDFAAEVYHMSRAFITDKEDWIYCPKAGERCMHAEEGKACSATGCDYFNREVGVTRHTSASLKVVTKKPKETKVSVADTALRRATKKAKLEKPKKWGGRSAFQRMH